MPKKTTTKKPAGGTNTAPVVNQPQSKTAAAVTAGVFLKTSDEWSTPYFDANDLRNLERKVFG
jgi:hypothetical protein